MWLFGKSLGVCTYYAKVNVMVHPMTDNVSEFLGNN